MGTVKDLVDVFKEQSFVKSLAELPARMEALERRMAALEKRLEKVPGETCPKCGEHALRLERSGRAMGNAGKKFRNEDWKCQSCGLAEEREATVTY